MGEDIPILLTITAPNTAVCLSTHCAWGIKTRARGVRLHGGLDNARGRRRAPKWGLARCWGAGGGQRGWPGHVSQQGVLESRARRRAGDAGTYKQGGKAITQSGLLLVGSRFRSRAAISLRLHSLAIDSGVSPLSLALFTSAWAASRTLTTSKRPFTGDHVHAVESHRQHRPCSHLPGLQAGP